MGTLKNLMEDASTTEQQQSNVQKGLWCHLLHLQLFVYYDTGLLQFVDDTKLMHTAQEPDKTREDVILVMQEGLNYWCGLIGCTGGKINQDKSHWCLIDYKWTGTE
jgi:hypothetical protein